MSAVKSMFGWIFRQGLLFILIVAAIAFHQFVWPRIAGGAFQTAVSQEWKSSGEIKADLMGLQQQAITDFNASRSDLLAQTGIALSASLQQKSAELATVNQALQQHVGVFASVRPSAIIAREKLKLQRASLIAEIGVLKSLTDRDARRLALRQITYPSEREVSEAGAACNTANAAVRAFNRGSYPRKIASNLISDRAARLTQAAKENCTTFRTKTSQRDIGLTASNAARAKLRQSEAALSRSLDYGTTSLKTYSTDAADETIRALLLKALVVLLVIIAMPFLIRTIFYYVLAPLAERRASIRISVPGSSNAAIAPAKPSRVSVPITLGTDEELLVRQDYLQTSSLSGHKDTRWLLDYRHLLSSIFSGLSFLTRIRGEGEMTTVSAVRDPFAELTELTLPQNASCVLHPRALVAVVQPIGRTMRITSHWRLFSLNAWLTLQLRYMVFHGPCRLIVKGARGIRIEPAHTGRIFGQDQLVGFSADLTYSVTRTETFGPYVFGREQLFKDKVQQGTGILIIEEAPLSSRRGRGARHGLEGVFDAGMKAFGL